jgi:hypothetical protein
MLLALLNKFGNRKRLLQHNQLLWFRLYFLQSDLQDEFVVYCMLFASFYTRVSTFRVFRKVGFHDLGNGHTHAEWKD